MGEGACGDVQSPHHLSSSFKTTQNLGRKLLYSLYHFFKKEFNKDWTQQEEPKKMRLNDTHFSGTRSPGVRASVRAIVRVHVGVRVRVRVRVRATQDVWICKRVSLCVR